MWYHVSEPNSYLAVTGAGIPTVRIVKKCFVYPFQRVSKISITPYVATHDFISRSCIAHE